MIRMMFKTLFVGYIVCNFVILVTSQERCFIKGVAGVCKNIKNCQPAIDDLKKRINPQICGFEGADPVVCCVDPTGAVTHGPTITTSTKRTTTTTEYVPPVYDYTDNTGGSEGQCETLPTSLTSPKTGRKAFDKCKEYQEQLVYPCGKSQALSGGVARVNNCGHTGDELIIGGENATLREFPHMALLGYGDQNNLQWLCGGSVISENYILTAGHCTFDRENGETTHVLVGTLRRSELSKAKIHRIKRIIRHPEYKPPIKYNDIALLELETPIRLDENTVPACLPVDSDLDESRAVATGWGATVYKKGNNNAEILQKVVLTKFSTEECSEKFPVYRQMPRGFDSNTQMCYGDRTQSKDTCQGDSGGPLQLKYKKLFCMYTVIGITSFGRACGYVGEPGIYTRVAPYTSWIEGYVWP